MLVTLQVCILKFKVKLVQSFFTFSIFFHFSADLAIKTSISIATDMASDAAVKKVHQWQW